jgi:hypothetical protein
MSAELRALSFLRTHLSLQEIADRLYVARPTVLSRSSTTRSFDSKQAPDASTSASTSCVWAYAWGHRGATEHLETAANAGAGEG